MTQKSVVINFINSKVKSTDDDSVKIINFMIQYLYDNDVESADELTEDQSVALSSLVDDYIDANKLQVNKLMSKTESAHDHAVLLRKHEVAKSLLRELDAKVAYYESLDIDSLVNKLAKYESLGEPDHLTLINKTESCNEGGSMEKTMDELKALLAQYQELGTVDEIKDLVTKAGAQLEEVCESRKKLESAKSSLAKYESLGTHDELAQFMTQFSQMRTKQESARLSAELKLPESLVTRTIEKMESVAVAEEYLRALAVDLAPVVSTSDVAKVESAEVVTQVLPKHESSMDSLRALCEKL